MSASDAFKKAMALHDAGDVAGAAALYRDLHVKDPNDGAVLHQISRIALQMGQYPMALAMIGRAVELAPHDAPTINQLGIVLSRMGENEKALLAFEHYIALKPDAAAGYSNRANALKSLRRYKEALADYEKALQRDPQLFMGRFNKGITHLILGDYQAGWPLLEDRKPGNLPPEGARFDPKKRWNGAADKNASLVLYNEQGMGDTIQFCRYVPEVAAKVGKLTVQAQAPLVPLLKNQWPGVEVIAESDPLASYTHQCPLMSLPSVLGHSIPGAGGYLKADAAKVAAWKARLAGPGKRIGLVWAGNPGHRNDHLRSIPLSLFAPLWDLPNTGFYAVQKDRDGEIGAAPLTPLGNALNDFADTAAALSALDLLISVDTAPLHLAGALGVKAIGLLQYDSDWRWLDGRTDTPWYSSLSLIRQERFNDWAGVIAQLRARLA